MVDLQVGELKEFISTSTRSKGQLTARDVVSTSYEVPNVQLHKPSAVDCNIE